MSTEDKTRQQIINILYPYDSLSESEIIEITNKIMAKIKTSHL